MMDDPVTKRLRDLLDITMKLRENIDELLGGLSKQLEALEREWPGVVRGTAGVSSNKPTPHVVSGLNRTFSHYGVNSEAIRSTNRRLDMSSGCTRISA